MVGWVIGTWIGLNVLFVACLWVRAVRRERLHTRDPRFFQHDDQVPELRTEGVDQ